MGGELTSAYDVYLNLKLKGFWNKKDIYNQSETPIPPRFISKRPRYSYTVGLDHKINLIKQASYLGAYQKTVLADANQSWPFRNNSFQNIFSNIGYWLSNPNFLFSELGRTLKSGGKAYLALQTPSLPKLCPSYRPNDFPNYSQLLTLLNGGRSECSNWRLSLKELECLIRDNGFKLAYHRYYLTSVTLKIWDIGFRPLTPVLTKMANLLTSRKRVQLKKEWIELLNQLLNPVFEFEHQEPKDGGYIYIILEKK